MLRSVIMYIMFERSFGTLTVQALLDHVLFKHGMRNTDYSALPKYYPSGSNVHKVERVTLLVSAKNIGTDGALSYNNTGGSCWSVFKPCHHQLHRGEMKPALHNISVFACSNLLTTNGIF